jgi:hypothetical protein
MVPHPGEQSTPFCFKVQVTPAPAPPFAPSFVTVAVSICVAFTATLAEVGETDTEMARIVMPAVILAPWLVTEVATRAILPKGGLTGAVYTVGIPLAVDVGETLPQPTVHTVVEQPRKKHRVICRLQVTPPLLGSLFTVAVKDCVPSDSTEAVGGAMETVIPTIVTVVEPVAPGLVMDAAVIVTIKLPAGGVDGAV